jgi:ubiquinone/menaquinone biosynthesis C-methylase UbiE
MYNDGFSNIIDIDFSPTIVDIMTERYKELELPIKCKYILIQDYQMNATDLKQFIDEQFKMIIEKGTLDSLLCGENCHQNVDKMLNEVYRVLANNGIFVSVSYGEKSRREFLFVKST